MKTIIDVRTVAEYNDGHAKGSINIPLNLVPEKLEEIKNMEQPILLCCASGGRSGQATSFLKQHGVDCSNGGSWYEVEQLMQ